ncbi:unnamed protein product [Oppiella nova]|uniref:tRNA-splicing endonuclease subunit Sen54 N-terminal domain-containing protein n=1 Tax=Oppiella nova TaxID=334625 RepID=A0A7R9LG97_9ACAR|nr:unnamed protein product [Oppiella nova]CAG2163292.1 unnamed protein product [Oppiella nova]
MSESFKSSLRHNQTPDDQWIQSLDGLTRLIDSKIECKRKSISEDRIKLNGSRGVWRCDLKLVEVTHNKGINGSIGLTINSLKYLKPFEALYLMESQSMEVLFDGIPLMIDETKCVSNESIIYEIKDNESAVELDSSLVLFNGKVKPLCDLGSILSSDELFSLIQSFGPKHRQYGVTSESKYNLIVDVFRQSDNKLEENPCFHVIVTKADQTVPRIEEVIDLQHKCRSKRLLFAVINSNDITFYSLAVAAEQVKRSIFIASFSVAIISSLTPGIMSYGNSLQNHMIHILFSVIVCILALI